MIEPPWSLASGSFICGHEADRNAPAQDGRLGGRFKMTRASGLCSDWWAGRGRRLLWRQMHGVRPRTAAPFPRDSHPAAAGECCLRVFARRCSSRNPRDTRGLRCCATPTPDDRSAPGPRRRVRRCLRRRDRRATRARLPGRRGRRFRRRPPLISPPMSACRIRATAAGSRRG